jgi:hypothetical protein
MYLSSQAMQEVEIGRIMIPGHDSSSYDPISKEKSWI